VACVSAQNCVEWGPMNHALRGSEPETVGAESDDPSIAIRIVIIIVGNALLLEGAASTSYTIYRFYSHHHDTDQRQHHTTSP
jgi:hypothetical protein